MRKEVLESKSGMTRCLRLEMEGDERLMGVQGFRMFSMRWQKYSELDRLKITATLDFSGMLPQKGIYAYSRCCDYKIGSTITSSNGQILSH